MQLLAGTGRQLGARDCLPGCTGHMGSPLPAPVLQQPWAPQESNRLLLGWWSSTAISSDYHHKTQYGDYKKGKSLVTLVSTQYILGTQFIC